MNSLEFIEKLINDIDTAIRLRKIDLKMYEALDDTEEIESNQYALKQLEDYMQHFQQIKTDLESWEVAKNRLEYFEGDSSVGIEEGVYQTSKYTPKEIKILKKNWW